MILLYGLAVAQLGSADELDDKEFVRRLADFAIRKSVPLALRAVAFLRLEDKHKAALLDAATRCEKEGTRQAAIEARTVVGNANAVSTAVGNVAAAAAYAAAAAAATYTADAAVYVATADKLLKEYAEDVVQILIEMKAPGCQWLGLTEEAAEA
jgi:hypothetical protein